MKQLALTAGHWEVVSHPHITLKERVVCDNLKLLEWRPIKVPCDILTHLTTSGLIENALISRNDLSCRWVEECDWALRTSFDVPEGFLEKDSEVFFRVHDLDCYAEVFLNDISIGHAANQFREHKFEVTEVLQPGNNSLLIYFRSAKKVTQVLEQVYGGLPSGFDTGRVHNRRCQCLTGWDWAARLSSPSLMALPEIISEPAIVIRDPFVWTKELSATSPGAASAAYAMLSLEVAVQSRRKAAGVLTVDISSADGTVHTSVQLPFQLKVGSNAVRTAVRLENAPLWWPLGMGSRVLLDARFSISATDRMGVPYTDSLQTKFAVRTVNVQQEKDALGESFVPHVNGHAVFCRGANWIPVSMLPAEHTEDQYRLLVAASAAAGMNCLRVWGGGFYERELFYDLCDELGILVWQDFMFACAAYPLYREFADEVEEEAIFQIHRLRNHPSVFLWCGNNENEWLHQIGELRKGKEAKIMGEPLWSNLLRKTAEDHDQSRPYHQSSPYGREKHDFNSMASGDRHNWECWARWQSPNVYLEDHGRFISEFGFQSFPSRKSIREFAPNAESTDDPILLHHQKMILGHERLARYMMELLGLPNTLDQWITGTQMLQAEILRRAVEHWRRLKFRTAGALIWQLHDAYPVIGWALIDYYRHPKLAYHAAKRFFAPVLLSIGLRAEGREVGAIPVELWSQPPTPQRLDKCELFAVLINDTDTAISGKIVIRIQQADSKFLYEHEQPISVDANTNSGELAIPLQIAAEEDLRSIVVHAEFVPDDGCMRALEANFHAIESQCAVAGGEAIQGNDDFKPDFQRGFLADALLVEPKYFLWNSGQEINGLHRLDWIKP